MAAHGCTTHIDIIPLLKLKAEIIIIIFMFCGSLIVSSESLIGRVDHVLLFLKSWVHEVSGLSYRIVLEVTSNGS